MTHVLDSIERAVRTVRRLQRERATAVLELELKELENVFALLVFGGFVGLPSPPAPLAAELLPLLERELRVAASRADLAHDPLAALAGTLDAG
ncbi:MAG: hypothetical protein KBB14_03740 [Thermoanaerobaculia bacterium]|nr:hypothetical protein [Thermoanaerobaculia bacterium]